MRAAPLEAAGLVGTCTVLNDLDLQAEAGTVHGFLAKTCIRPAAPGKLELLAQIAR
ncbi:MAG: hypothetical protein Q3999_06685 [Buchananella hordeovulneris]|nr:hypothetical protein [Buchananella hordeovulneris]